MIIEIFCKYQNNPLLCNFPIYLYDINNNLILKCKLNNGYLQANIKNKGIYKVVILNTLLMNKKEIFVININKKYNKYCFNLYNSNTIKRNNNVLVLLTDVNYTNLPIEKGSLTWQAIT